MNNIVLDEVTIDKDSILNAITFKTYNISSNTKLVINVESSINSCTFNLGENSSLVINKKYNKKELVEEVTINLNGINSSVNYNFSTLTSNDQKYIINVNHNNKNTSSNIINHGVVKNDSKLVFEVNSIVKKGNSGSFLNQESKIIVMSLNNSIIKPNMYIDEFDVDARHAATIGRFSNDELFYLKTKGIDDESSKELLISGFLNGHIGR